METVRVINGHLKGLIEKVEGIDRNQTKLVITIDMLGVRGLK